MVKQKISRDRKTKTSTRATKRVIREPGARYAVRKPSYKAVVSAELPRAVERIANALHPEKIILSGSYAYGKPTYDSDLDLLVIWDTDASRNERHLAVARLLRPRVFALDLLVRTPQEIEHGMEIGNFFLQEIVTQGKTLYERGN